MDKAILISVSLPNKNKNAIFNSLDELSNLSTIANINIIDKIIQIRNKLHPKYFIGSGKLRELKNDILKKKVNIIIFDDDLSLTQTRNIEGILNCKVIGRSELILNIFASRAKTKAAKLQVEHAQLSYLLPRLKRRWTHLSRIEGGIGLKGPGETQLETDKRSVKRRLYVIKKLLKKISTNFATKRKKRTNQNIVCLVGYTNAGKSSLLNLLSNSKVFVDNAPFTTLDSTVRKAYISPNLTIILIDTVGFINKLPHHLIASFKSTLEELTSAKLLLHIIDVSYDGITERINCVNKVINDLKAPNASTIYVFNKIDKLNTNKMPKRLMALHNKSCFISAKTEQGIDILKKMIENSL